MNKIILDALSPISVPIAYMTYSGSDSEYVIFNYWSTPYVHADNLLRQENVTVQIDVFSSGNFKNLVSNVIQLMRDSGFMKGYEGVGEYNDDVERFRKTIRFSYGLQSDSAVSG